MNVDKKINETKADLNKVSEHIADAANEVKKQAEQYSDEFATYIKDCPIKSVFIASAIGLLIGKFIL
jgi:ElaB/YqjD/DUF883 family membrane-anchored ribosome-binding protein